MKNKRAGIIRKIVQIVFFVVIALIAVNHGLEKYGKTIPLVGSSSLHAVCPFGGVVSIYQFITEGSFVRMTHESSFILMIIVSVMAVFFGPAFCGWICPFGTLQELIGKLGRKLLGKRYNRIIPERLDRVLRYLRYFILVWVLFMTAVIGKVMFSSFDPYFTLFNFWTGHVAVSGLIILLITFLLSLLVERPYCKYACPYGAFLGLFNLFRIMPIRREKDTCISCGLCDKECPMNIKVSKSETIRNHQCISCMRCTSEQICPEDATVTLSILKKKRGVSSTQMAVILSIMFIGGVALSMAFNLWNTESKKRPSRFTEGVYLGYANPADIRGSFTLGNVSEAFGIDIKVLSEAFGVKSSNPSILKIKELESMTSSESDIHYGTDSIRLFVSRYKGVPYIPEEDTHLPLSAIRVLEDKLTPADLDELR
ncbi:MAG: 4Fe-4S binding protein [Spirochaetales bacterium]|nr:4Fe-4S binding protein [Spirochaetales bacterium]